MKETVRTKLHELIEWHLEQSRQAVKRGREATTLDCQQANQKKAAFHFHAAHLLMHIRSHKEEQ